MDSNTPQVPLPHKIQQSTDETDLQIREILLKEREVALKEQEARAKIQLDQRGIWFSSPVLIGIVSAVFGLVGTGIGAALQGYSNFQLERQKFEFSLIQKALENKERKEAAKQLLFLVDSGAIQSLNSERIRKLAANPSQLPSIVGLDPVDNDCNAGAETISSLTGGVLESKKEYQNFELKIRYSARCGTKWIAASGGISGSAIYFEHKNGEKNVALVVPIGLDNFYTYMVSADSESRGCIKFPAQKPVCTNFITIQP